MLGKDDSDSGWSDNELEQLPPPPANKQLQRNSSFKPVINRPPDKSKPPPAAVVTNPAILANKSINIDSEDLTFAHSHSENSTSQVDNNTNSVVSNTFVPSKESGVFSREAELEKQLEKTHSELIAARREKSALEKSVLELQDRLTLAETNASSTVSMKHDNIGTVDSNIRRGEREKDLEKQLVKVKKEKDKALRLLISLIGKVLVVAMQTLYYILKCVFFLGPNCRTFTTTCRSTRSS